jgi:hypothetical protein
MDRSDLAKTRSGQTDRLLTPRADRGDWLSVLRVCDPLIVALEYPPGKPQCMGDMHNRTRETAPDEPSSRTITWRQQKDNPIEQWKHNAVSRHQPGSHSPTIRLIRTTPMKTGGTI